MPSTDDYVSIYTPPVRVDPSTACLVVVDLMYATGHPDFGLGKLLQEQGRFADAAYRFRRIAEQVLPNTLRLLAWAREHDMRRMFLSYGSEVSDYSDLSPQMFELCRATRNRVGYREHELLDELERRDDERLVNKLTPSAFASSPMDLILRTYGCDTLLFTGVSTNMCVEGTLRDAADRGFGCVLVEDACGADSEEYHAAACAVIRRLYGHVESTQALVDQLEKSRTQTARSAPVGVG
jgi:nicotinamidase-related amidase